MSTTSQCDMVLDMLRSHDYVTPFMAFREKGITRLAARVYDLRARGHEITTLPKVAKNGGRYACYYLEGKNEG